MVCGSLLAKGGRSTTPECEANINVKEQENNQVIRKIEKLAKAVRNNNKHSLVCNDHKFTKY